MTRFTLLVALLAGCHQVPAPPPAPAPPAPPASSVVAPFAVTTVGHGPPIVFIPGLSSPGSVWDRAVAHLATRYTCHVLTLAGFAGQPAMPGAPFLPRERDAILAYIRAHHLAKPIVVGHSIGGFLAYAIAEEAPSEIGGVVAIDGLPFMPALQNAAITPAELEPQAAQLRTMFAGMDHAAFAHQTEAALAGMITRPDDVARVARDADRSDPRTVGQAIYDLMTTDLRPGLAAIHVPVWLVKAGDEMTEAFTAQLANAPDHRTVVAKTAKHFVMLDDPDFVDTTLDAFLAGVEARAPGGEPPSEARAHQ